MREWKPGDVAIVTDFYGRTGRGICNVAGGWDFTPPGSKVSRYSGAGEIINVRPLVVVDPENAEQVARLHRLIFKMPPVEVIGQAIDVDRDSLDYDSTAAALREFADPKPDEPTGLGAVVEDAAGVLWVRLSAITFSADAWWRREGGGAPYNERRTYADLDAVKVLSEGVTP